MAIAPHGSPGARSLRVAQRWNDRIAASRCATDDRARPSPEDAQVGPQVGPRRAPPVRAPRAEPVEVGTDGGGVGALGVRRGVARGEGAEEPREGGIGRLAGRLPAHASGAGSTGRVRLVVDRPPDRAPPRGRPPPFVAATGPRATAGACRTGEGLGVRRAAGVLDARHDVGRRRVAGRAADQAHRRLVLARQRAVVGVVQAAERLVVRREVAARVVGAPPEDVPGAPRATRDEMTVLVLGADDLERERIGRRRAVLLDVLAVRIARAADERAEPPALADQRPCAALGADLAGPLLGRRLVTRDRPGLLVLRVERAGQERGRSDPAG